MFYWACFPCATFHQPPVSETWAGRISLITGDRIAFHIRNTSFIFCCCLLVCFVMLTRGLLSVSISVERWLLTSESRVFWETDRLEDACLAPWTDSSCRWSTRQPWVKTSRRLHSAGVLTSAWTSLWRAVTSNGRGSQAQRCLCSTGPVCVMLDGLKANGQQWEWSLPRWEGRRHCRARRRTFPVRPRNTRAAARRWRKRQRRARARRWRGSRQTLQVRTLAGSEKTP